MIYTLYRFYYDYCTRPLHKRYLDILRGHYEFCETGFDINISRELSGGGGGARCYLVIINMHNRDNRLL